MQTDEFFPDRIPFSDEVVFQVNGKTNKQNDRIWGAENLH